MSKPRILILGASGMLGSQLWKSLLLRFPDTWGTLRGAQSEYDQFQQFSSERLIYSADVLNKKHLIEVLELIRPNVVLNCVGVTKRHEGHDRTPDITAKIIQTNSVFPFELAAWAKTSGARVIHFSTDCVFDGKQGGYSEADAPNAIDLYGRSKAIGELSEKDGNCLTLRSSFIGRELYHKTELLEWVLKQEGKTIHGFRRAHYSGLATWVLAELVGDLVDKFPNLVGLYHVASEPITKYELVGLIAKTFQLEIEIVPDDETVVKRNLDGSKFHEATGFVAPAWSEMVKGILNGY